MARVERDEVLILGGVTHKNRGDLAMMEGQFTQLREISPAIKPVFCSWNATLQPRGKRSFWVCSEIMRVRAPFDRASGVWAVFMPNTDFSRLADTYREEVK